jgi:molybdate transport system permease protein
MQNAVFEAKQMRESGARREFPGYEQSMIEIIATSLELAGTTSILLLLITIPLGWWLAQKRGWGVDMIAAAAALPLVLPPTVLGFYLLLFLGPHGPWAPILRLFGLRTLAFSFPGLVTGSLIYSLPFALTPIRAGFAAVPPHLMEAATSLRAGAFDRFRHIALPIARPSIVAALILGFAHTLGEFGVVLMIGGDIPGHTRVLSTSIFDAVEELDYTTAHELSAGLLVFSFLTILALRRFDRSGAI